MNEINGGVTAAEGFFAAAAHCGVRKNKTKKDLALIVSTAPAAAAGVYTKNAVKASPLLLTMENLTGGRARAVIVNSGNANACAPNGYENAKKMCAAAANALNIPETEVIVASTGIIGQELNVGAIISAVPALAKALDKNSAAAAEAIMTTDLKKKETALEFTLGGKTCKIGGIAKGSGMIHPNMGTMLAFITTDAAITPALLSEALKDSVKKTYNRVSVDGDTSTNDMCAVMANGLAQNKEITSKDADYYNFCAALDKINESLARMIARDGEGATKLITVTVGGADSESDAEKLAMSVVSSSLVKSAMFGADANWGRVLCAMGYSGAKFDPVAVSISFSSAAGGIKVCSDSVAEDFDEVLAKKILCEDEIEILIGVGKGGASATVWGCDLTYDYVKINGEYRT